MSKSSITNKLRAGMGAGLLVTTLLTGCGLIPKPPAPPEAPAPEPEPLPPIVRIEPPARPQPVAPPPPPAPPAAVKPKKPQPPQQPQPSYTKVMEAHIRAALHDVKLDSQLSDTDRNLVIERLMKPFIKSGGKSPTGAYAYLPGNVSGIFFVQAAPFNKNNELYTYICLSKDKRITHFREGVTTQSDKRGAGETMFSSTFYVVSQKKNVNIERDAEKLPDCRRTMELMQIMLRGAQFPPIKAIKELK